MWRREQSDPQARRAINAFEHRARRAFAICSGDVDEAEFVLRIAREFSEFARDFQPEARAKNLETGKKLDGFRVGHLQIVKKDFAQFRSSTR